MILLYFLVSFAFYGIQSRSVGKSAGEKSVTPTNVIITMKTQQSRNQRMRVPKAEYTALLSPTPPMNAQTIQHRKNMIIPIAITEAEPNPPINAHPKTQAVEIRAASMTFNQVHLRLSLLYIIPHIIAEAI